MSILALTLTMMFGYVPTHDYTEIGVIMSLSPAQLETFARSPVVLR